MMAKVVDISASSVQRIWRAHGLRPHRVKQFKLSTDRNLLTKLREIVGLYVDPPAHAVVLSVDEKSQIQALDRTQPGLPMKKGRVGTMTHDYKRHGTTTLFAALNVLDGTVIGRNMQRLPAPGIHPLPECYRGAGAGPKVDPRHRRQLCNPQASEGGPMARPSSPLDLPLHPNFGILAQRCRGLLRHAHPAAIKARGL